MIDILAPYDAEQTIRSTIAVMGPAIARACDEHHLVVRTLEPKEPWTNVVRDYKHLGLNDACLGLFDPERMMIVLREPKAHIIAHETAHLVDWLLGDPLKGRFRSDLDPVMKEAYRARVRDGFTISAYAEVNVREFVAECSRAWFGFGLVHPKRADDLTRLRNIDPTMVTHLAGWFDEFEARYSRDTIGRNSTTSAGGTTFQ